MNVKFKKKRGGAVGKLKQAGVMDVYRLCVGDDEDDQGGWFQPHTAKHKPSRDIINSWIFCVYHLTAGQRWKGPAKLGIPPQL